MAELVQSFITVVLGSGAAIAITRLVFDHRRETRQQGNAVSYLALRLAFQFESYAVMAASKASDHRTAVEHEGNAGAFLGKVPQPEALPESDAYQLLDRSILGDVLDFPQRCQMANEAAMFWWNIVGDRDCCNVALEENTIQMGHRAVEIARNLRAKYGLGDRKLQFGEWDIEAFFDRELKRLSDLMERRKAQDAEVNVVATTGETGRELPRE